MGCLWSCLMTCRKCLSKRISYTVQRLPRDHQHYSTADTRRAWQIIFSTSQALPSKKTSGGVEARRGSCPGEGMKTEEDWGRRRLASRSHSFACDFNELKSQVPHSSWDWQGIYEKVTHGNIFACLVAKATLSLVFMVINTRALRPALYHWACVHRYISKCTKSISNMISLMRRGLQQSSPIDVKAVSKGSAIPRKTFSSKWKTQPQSATDSHAEFRLIHWITTIQQVPLTVCENEGGSVKTEGVNINICSRPDSSFPKDALGHVDLPSLLHLTMCPFPQTHYYLFFT